jgi:hypothetical protein
MANNCDGFDNSNWMQGNGGGDGSASCIDCTAISTALTAAGVPATGANAALATALAKLASLPAGAVIVGGPAGTAGAPGAPTALTPNLTSALPQVLAVNPATDKLEFRPIGATQKHILGAGAATTKVAPYNGAYALVAGTNPIDQMPGSITVNAAGAAVFTAPVAGVYEISASAWLNSIFTVQPSSPGTFVDIMELVASSGPIERISENRVHYDPAQLVNSLNAGGNFSSGSGVFMLAVGDTVQLQISTAADFASGTVQITAGARPTLMSATLIS